MSFPITIHHLIYLHFILLINATLGCHVVLFIRVHLTPCCCELILTDALDLGLEDGTF